jgi:hypothetical protein
MSTAITGENERYVSDLLRRKLVEMLAICIELALEHGLAAISASVGRIGRSHTNVQGRPTARNSCLREDISGAESWSRRYEFPLFSVGAAVRNVD